MNFRVIQIFVQNQPKLTYSQKKYIATTNLKCANKPRPVFNRKSKQLQKCRAAISPDVSLYEYLKDEVSCAYLFNSTS